MRESAVPRERRPINRDKRASRQLQRLLRLRLYRRRGLVWSGAVEGDVQAGQVVDQVGVLTIEIVRLDVQLNQQYCRREDCVFPMIFVIKLTKANDR
jgi:hypothetical protein